MMLLVRVAFDVSEMPMSPASAGCLAIDPSICLVLVVKNGRSIEWIIQMIIPDREAVFVSSFIAGTGLFGARIRMKDKTRF
jgi:hypothetical protein